jgi:hypothetical protein
MIMVWLGLYEKEEKLNLYGLSNVKGEKCVKVEA